MDKSWPYRASRMVDQELRKNSGTKGSSNSRSQTLMPTYELNQEWTTHQRLKKSLTIESGNKAVEPP
ncbi:hypothetical protein TNCV_2866531 [Trichonephila clavipes]|nr:hypothetical protein TNCV_2866531 [Trichonephila clavipes]